MVLVAAANQCIHGFAPGTCLICRTLEPSQPTTAAPSSTRRGGRSDRPGGAVEPVAGRSRKLTAGPRVVPSATEPARFPLGFRLLGIAFAVVIVAVVALTLFHLVFAVVLRIVELVGVAVVTGYVGWKAGVHHGRRTAGR
jgi:hypothetical protein